MQPIRIQLSRKKGWRKPPNTVVVTRPGKWGNPFRADDPAYAVAAFRFMLESWRDFTWVSLSKIPLIAGDLPAEIIIGELDGTPRRPKRIPHELFPRPLLLVRMPNLLLYHDLHQLRGKNLACWCGMDCICHADVLLDWANREGQQ